MLAPASSTNDAAICVTAKIRCRRFDAAGERTLPAESVNPLDAPPTADADESQQHGRDDRQPRAHPQHAGIHR